MANEKNLKTWADKKKLARRFNFLILISIFIFSGSFIFCILAAPEANVIKCSLPVHLIFFFLIFISFFLMIFFHIKRGELPNIYSKRPREGEIIVIEKILVWVRVKLKNKPFRLTLIGIFLIVYGIFFHIVGQNPDAYPMWARIILALIWVAIYWFLLIYASLFAIYSGFMHGVRKAHQKKE